MAIRRFGRQTGEHFGAIDALACIPRAYDLYPNGDRVGQIGPGGMLKLGTEVKIVDDSRGKYVVTDTFICDMLPEDLFGSVRRALIGASKRRPWSPEAVAANNSNPNRDRGRRHG